MSIDPMYGSIIKEGNCIKCYTYQKKYAIIPMNRIIVN